MVRFKLRVLWLNNTLGIAIDQIYGHSSVPLTGYHFWPQNNAWDLIRIDLVSKIWLSEEERNLILNSVTEILNQWKQGKSKVQLNNLAAENEFIDLCGS